MNRLGGDRRRWAMLIQRIYQTDPLHCPKCGGTMKIIAFVEARQGEVIRRLLEHFGLWQNPPSRAPPQGPWPPRPARSIPEDDPAIASGTAYEVDPDFLEHARREDLVQPDLPWDR